MSWGSAGLNFEWQERIYPVEAQIVKNLIYPAVIGMDILREHRSITFDFNGPKSPINICLSLNEIMIKPLKLIPDIDISKIRPIAIPSRPHYKEKEFFARECQLSMNQ